MRFLLPSIACIFLACQLMSSPQELVIEYVEQPLADSLPRASYLASAADTNLELAYAGGTLRLHIKYPQDSFRGTLLLLPGWDYSPLDWCTKSSICQLALDSSYALILPEMQRSIYAYEHYPETRADRRKYAQRAWMLDSLFPFLQDSFRFLLPEQEHYILGLSTGGRGAVLLALDCPEPFRAVAALSGDFEQRRMPKDKLMQAVYGSFGQFPERWAGIDNPLARAQYWELPLYLGHGYKDKVVPPEQTSLFAQELQKKNPEIPVQLHIDSLAAHTYIYWGSEVDSVWQFFMRYR